MKNLIKRLFVVGALSLGLLFNNVKAQLPENDSVNLKALYWTYDAEDYPKFEWNCKPEEYKITREPAFYAGCALAGGFLIGLGNYFSHDLSTPKARQHFAKETLCIFSLEVMISVPTYIISDRIIKKREEKKHRF